MSTTTRTYGGGPTTALSRSEPSPENHGTALTSNPHRDCQPNREEHSPANKSSCGGKQLENSGSGEGFATLWNAWKTTACSLHRLSRMAIYPSLPRSQLDSLPITRRKGDYFLPSHFPDSGEEHIPARAVISYQDFKKVRFSEYVRIASENSLYTEYN